MEYNIGDNVGFRGEYTDVYSVPGKIEAYESNQDKPYGVRFCNGNFRWADTSQLILSERVNPFF